MVNKPPQLIIANGYAQANHLAKYSMGLKREEWRYVPQHTAFWLSFHPGYVWLYGTYFQRQDWPEIEHQCCARGITLLRIEERR